MASKSTIQEVWAKKEMAADMHRTGDYTIEEVAKFCGIGPKLSRMIHDAVSQE